MTKIPITEPSSGSAVTPAARRRPGPFGPASALLPENQQVETVLVTDSAASALERLVDSRYSQLPAVDLHGHVHGVFTWESFGRRMSEIHTLGLDLATLHVWETDLEKPRFIAPDTYIDTGADWKEVDYVLVGDADRMLGILTLTDIYGRLNDFAEAFVLLYEIEQEIRDLFGAIYPGDDLQKLMDELCDASDEPETQAAVALGELLAGTPPLVADEVAVKKITFAIGQMNKASRQKARSRSVQTLEDFTFAQYRGVIFDADHWPRFDQVFRQRREILLHDFARINDLRNTVFHFRRCIVAKDTDLLRRFRNKLRYARELICRNTPHPYLPEGQGDATLSAGIRRPR
jgi:CBS domain-containing protein